MITMYKRNAQGKPIYWGIQKYFDGNKTVIKVAYGMIGKTERTEIINTHRDLDAEIKSLVTAKRKEGYKELKDLYDNAPEYLPDQSLWYYLNDYLPKDNTHADGNFIPMLCKTLNDNKPFEKGSYFGQWKINGERCIITAAKSDDLFQTIKLHYRSREGADWTDKLSYLDDEIITPLKKNGILDMMIEEGVALDGELYIPGYNINDINHFIKNTDVPQHYQLQYWMYDICIENMSAGKRQSYIWNRLSAYAPYINSIEDHLNIATRFNVLPSETVFDFNDAINRRDKYISLGFEGLVIREDQTEYQFGGKRNNAMLKFKKKLDGYFEILDIREDKRGLPIYILKNDINDEVFECTLNATQDVQRSHLNMKEALKGKKGLVEYRERSGVKQVPFHAKLIQIMI